MLSSIIACDCQSEVSQAHWAHTRSAVAGCVGYKPQEGKIGGVPNTPGLGQFEFPTWPLEFRTAFGELPKSRIRLAIRSRLRRRGIRIRDPGSSSNTDRNSGGQAGNSNGPWPDTCGVSPPRLSFGAAPRGKVARRRFVIIFVEQVGAFVCLFCQYIRDVVTLCTSGHQRLAICIASRLRRRSAG